MKTLLTTILATTISFGGATAIQQKNQYDMEQEIQRLHAIVSLDRAMTFLGESTSSQNHINTWESIELLWKTLRNSGLFDRKETLQIRDNLLMASGWRIQETERRAGYEEKFMKFAEESFPLVEQYKLDHDQDIWTFKEKDEEEI